MSESPQPMRKSFACDECKRRKIRCSGGARCASCARDAKACRYSSPSQKLAALQRRLQESESIRRRLEEAWKSYLPEVDLGALLCPQSSAQPVPDTAAAPITEMTDDAAAHQPAGVAEHVPGPPPENGNAEDFEFDESQDPERAIDGMIFLTADPHKSGYTGPQSGIAALKFLQSLPSYLPIPSSISPLSGLDDEAPEAASHSTAAKNRYIDYYFELYHPAYPILHEGTFRARPRDGSWALLYHAVLAIGAFVSATSDGNSDLPLFREARRHLSMDILEKGSLGYVQALTLLANYLQKRNKPNAGFLLMGTAFNMALAIGLHREFDAPNTSSFTMEIRRRTWWTLFVFISGAQLTLGRPATSLFGVNVQLPANLDDLELAVDMDAVPAARPEEPTVASCLIEQVKLATIGNTVHDELLTHRRPSHARALEMDAGLRQWRRALPRYFDEAAVLEPRLECPKRVLLWRHLNLRIVLHRPFVFEAIAKGAPLSTAAGEVRACLVAADECVASICGFVGSLACARRGFAWYVTAWLITASFVQATCLIYAPDHELADGWRAALQDAADCLQTLGSALETALRARDILQNVLDEAPRLSPARYASAADGHADNKAATAVSSAGRATHEAQDNLFTMEFDTTWMEQAGDFLGVGFMCNGLNVL